MTVIDLFAGPGGWDVAAAELGIHPLGIEHDDAACATRKAAGLRTLQADVASLDPATVLREHFAPRIAMRVNGENGKGGNVPRSVNEPAPTLTTHGRESWLHGLIASPPCQAFSMAGKGEGRGAMDAYREAIGRMAAREVVDVAALDEASGDPRGHLVLEPLRWALALRPRWIALEQVPPVLPLWEAMAGVLRAEGYSVATGILSAEQYGVPQTRKRAILLASLDGEVRLPRPMHQRYIAPRSRDDEGGGMFDLPEPGRVVAPEDRDLLPWVSMGVSLGWTREDAWLRSSMSDVGTSKSNPRHIGEPAATITGKHRSAEWVFQRPATTVNGDPRISEPGHHDAEVSGSQQANAVRVTLQEALILQSFDPAYPVQGSKTKRFEQVGNAVPPLLAWHVLSEVVEANASERAA